MATFDSTSKGTKVTGGKKTKPKGVPTSGPRLAEWLKNPGLRSKLPDQALTAALLAQRKKNQYNAAPAAPGSGYTNKQLDALIAAEANTKFGGAETTLNTALGQANTQYQTTVPSYFDAYRQTLSGIQQAQAGQQKALQDSLGTLAAQAGQVQAPPGSDPAGVQRAAAANSQLSAGVSNQAALAQNLGKVQSDYQTNQQTNSFGQQAAALQSVFQKQQEIQGQLADLAGQKGDFKTTQRSQILSDETDNALKAALTGSQITQNTASAAATTATAGKTAADQKFFDEHGYYPPTGPPKPKPAKTGYQAGGPGLNKYGYTYDEWKKLSPAAKDKARSKGASTTAAKPASGPGSLPSASEAKAVSNINRYAQVLLNGTKGTNPVTGNVHNYKPGAEALDYLLKVLHVDPHQLNVARSLAANKNKGIGKWGVGEAHKAGVHVGGNWDIL